MTLKQLEVFVAVAHTCSFSRGAEKTFITQSTASQHIKSLEEELGIRLFDRGQTGTLLTEGGKLFRARAEKILADCAESVACIRRFRDMENVQLFIGASTIPGTCFIPAVLSRFLNEQRGVKLIIRQGDSRSVIGQLLSEEVELGFVGGRYGGEDKLHYEPVGTDSILLVASPDSITAKKGSLSQSELCRIPLLFREQGSGTQQAVDDALARTWIRSEALKIVAVLGSSEAVKRALLNGVGAAFVSRLSVADEIESGRLLTLRVPGLTVKRNFYAVYREGRELSPAAAAFLKCICSSQGKV